MSIAADQFDTERSAVGRWIAAAAAYATRRRMLVLAYAVIPFSIVLNAVIVWSDPALRWRFPLGHDFVAFWVAAELYAEGGAAHLYDLGAFLALQAEVGAGPPGLLWHYPPQYLAMVLPLAGLSLGAAFCAFTAVNLAAIGAVALRFLPFEGFAGWAALFGAPVMAAALIQGQNGAFFAACLIGGFVARERDWPWLSACLFALILAKPQYGVLIPVVLLADRDIGAILRTALTCALFTAAVTIGFGLEIWGYVFENTHMLGLVMKDHEILAQIPSIWSAMTLAGASPVMATIPHAAGALVAIVLVSSLWRRQETSRDLRLAGLFFGTLMISPYFLRYDMIMTLAGTLLLIRHARSIGMPPVPKLILAAMWLLPGLFPAIALLTNAQIGPLVSIAGLWLTVRWALQAGVAEPRPLPQTDSAVIAS